MYQFASDVWQICMEDTEKPRQKMSRRRGELLDQIGSRRSKPVRIPHAHLVSGQHDLVRNWCYINGYDLLCCVVEHRVDVLRGGAGLDQITGRSVDLASDLDAELGAGLHVRSGLFLAAIYVAGEL